MGERYTAYDGSGQPVRDDVLVAIQCRNDATPPMPASFFPAQHWNWSWMPDDPDNDIVAYTTHTTEKDRG